MQFLATFLPRQAKKGRYIFFTCSFMRFTVCSSTFRCVFPIQANRDPIRLTKNAFRFNRQYSNTSEKSDTLGASQNIKMCGQHWWDDQKKVPKRRVLSLKATTYSQIICGYIVSYILTATAMAEKTPWKSLTKKQKIIQPEKVLENGWQRTQRKWSQKSPTEKCFVYKQPQTMAALY